MNAASPENVADLISKPPKKHEPEHRHVSRYRKEIIKAEKRGKSAHKTLGVANVILDPPSQYLKKRGGIAPKKPQVHHKHYHRPGYQHKLPDWQPIKASERDKQIVDSQIDFTKRNIIEAKNLRPIKPRKYYVDDRHGNCHPLKTSGLFPLYRNRKSYGEVPDTISPTIIDHAPRQKTTRPEREDKAKGHKHEELGKQDTKTRAVLHVKDQSKGDKNVREKRQEKSNKDEKTKKEIKSLKKDSDPKERNDWKSINSNENEDEQSTTSTLVEHQQPRCRYVTEDERAELLHGMKIKWDELMKQFQCLPFLTDTPPKAKRKSNMEKDLLQLEKDIQIIEEHPYIYVYSDDEAG